MRAADDSVEESDAERSHICLALPRPRSLPPRRRRPAVPSFDPQRLPSTSQTLGSDAFEGRAPATAGETKTVAYLVDQFAKAGLSPAAT